MDKTPPDAAAIWHDAGERYALAVRLFDEAVDPHLIDAAIFEMNAAESWMSYAIELARKTGVEIGLAPLISPHDRIMPEKSG